MNVREADLIGIGKKFQIATSYGEEVIIVIHDDGRRELYSYNAEENETTSIMTLNDDEARGVAGILGGLAYKPKALENVEVALHDLTIEWYKVPADSPAISKSIGELQVRKQTGAMIIAALGATGTIINPGPEFVITAGTTLVISGKREHIKELKAILLSK
jgi:TrkA domain protein